MSPLEDGPELHGKIFKLIKGLKIDNELLQRKYPEFFKEEESEMVLLLDNSSSIDIEIEEKEKRTKK